MWCNVLSLCGMGTVGLPLLLILLKFKPYAALTFLHYTRPSVHLQHLISQTPDPGNQQGAEQE